MSGSCSCAFCDITKIALTCLGPNLIWVSAHCQYLQMQFEYKSFGWQSCAPSILLHFNCIDNWLFFESIYDVINTTEIPFIYLYSPLVERTVTSVVVILPISVYTCSVNSSKAEDIKINYTVDIISTQQYSFEICLHCYMCRDSRKWTIHILFIMFFCWWTWSSFSCFIFKNFLKAKFVLLVKSLLFTYKLWNFELYLNRDIIFTYFIFACIKGRAVGHTQLNQGLISPNSVLKRSLQSGLVEPSFRHQISEWFLSTNLQTSASPRCGKLERYYSK